METIYPKCWLAIRFRMPYTAYENMVSLVTGGSIHTDIVLHRDGSDSGQYAYTAFMNMPFHMHKISDGEKFSDLYKNLQIDITEDEFQKCTDYLSVWVNGKLRYNYSDTFVGIPTVGGDGTNGNIIMPDVDGARPETLRTVYCSQAATLVMRECLDPKGDNKSLVESLKQLNSRTTSPHGLYMAMVDHSHMASNMALFTKPAKAAPLYSVTDEDVDEDSEYDTYTNACRPNT